MNHFIRQLFFVQIEQHTGPQPGIEREHWQQEEENKRVEDI